MTTARIDARFAALKAEGRAGFVAYVMAGDLTRDEALEILRGLRGINLVGMDVVEVAPPYDHAEVTALAGATLAMEMVCLYAYRHKLG